GISCHLLATRGPLLPGQLPFCQGLGGEGHLVSFLFQKSSSGISIHQINRPRRPRCSFRFAGLILPIREDASLTGPRVISFPPSDVSLLRAPQARLVQRLARPLPICHHSLLSAGLSTSRKGNKS